MTGRMRDEMSSSEPLPTRHAESRELPVPELLVMVALPLVVIRWYPLLGLAVSGGALLSYWGLGYEPTVAGLATLVLAAWVVASKGPLAPGPSWWLRPSGSPR